MIALTKLSEPEVLAQNRDAWTAEFTEGTDRRRYAHEQIRQKLREETHRKCAYCESRMEHVAPPHVEHILPKSKRPELVCDWNNLTAACPTCNTKKGDYYSTECPIVNPYVDDPSDHLQWAGPWLFHVTEDRGRLTVSRLKLNREMLMYQRGVHLERALSIMEMIDKNPGPVGEALRENLNAMMADDAEYAAAVRAFVDKQDGLGSGGGLTTSSVAPSGDH
jgi:uncharacterized protein (TIGR02646 family)